MGREGGRKIGMGQDRVSGIPKFFFQRKKRGGEKDERTCANEYSKMLASVQIQCREHACHRVFHSIP